jgi:hypothetical protein
MKEELQGGGGGKIVFQIFNTLIYMAALSTIHDVTGRSRVKAIYLCDIYGLRGVRARKTEHLLYLGFWRIYCGNGVSKRYRKSFIGLFKICVAHTKIAVNLYHKIRLLLTLYLLVYFSVQS